MTRIISGQARGRRLAVPPRGTRPTSDRVRESLFSSLDSEFIAAGQAWSDAVVLDLYAGSGALGLEALSRGARSVTFVENARPAMSVLRANVAAVGLSGASVLPRDAQQLAQVPPGEPATLCLVDPPYDVPASTVVRVLDSLAQANWLRTGCRVVVERGARDRADPMPAGWSERERAFGDTVLWYGHVVKED